MVHLIVMQQRSTATPGGGNSLRKHRDHGIELLARKISIRIRRAHESIHLVFAPRLAGRFSDDLLGENVERVLRNLDALQVSAANAVDERGAFDQLVARGREEDPARLRADPVSRTSDTLQSDRNRPRRSDLDGEIHGADIDTEFERGGCDNGFQFTILQADFRFLTQRARQTAVVRQDDIRSRDADQERARGAPTCASC